MATIENVELPWSDAVILVCSKCFTRRGANTGELKSVDETKGFLKASFKHAGFKGKLRVVVSSCLDICPDDKLAIVIARRERIPSIKAIKVDFDITHDQLFHALRNEVK